MSNLGWLFYKDYFKGIDYADFENSNNKDIIQSKVKNLISQTVTSGDDEKLGNIHFKATTTYPGLILGSGNAHELPSIEGQAILGFSFDYTSGLPVIAGSSVKGVLGSAFKHPEYIIELLKIMGVGGFSPEQIAKLETEIFDNGDIFFDAVVTTNGKILADDFLTPHGDNPLKNPKPLRFIKVAPNVSFRFDFELGDGLMSTETKAILFANILSDLGIGAKTNVGYGKFSSDLVSRAKLAIESQKEEELKQDKEREEKEKADSEAEALASLDSNVEKIKIKIKDLTKKDTKDIYDIVVTYELDDSEKKELISHLMTHIGEKPAPKKKAPIKWAIRLYEILGHL